MLDDELIRRQRRAVRNMPPVVTCDNCGLTYYQTSAPHVCAGWTRGAKENMEVSKICNDHPWEKCPKCGVGICQEHMVAFLNHEPHYAKHEPVARGGEGERVRIELISGVEGQCVSINDYRICGPKPWGGGSVAKSWNAEKNDILRAFLTPDQKHAWLADDLEVVSVNQHRSLLAERERLREAATKALAAFRYMRDVDTQWWDFHVTPEICTAWDKLRAVLNDQKGE